MRVAVATCFGALAAFAASILAVLLFGAIGLLDTSCADAQSQLGERGNDCFLFHRPAPFYQSVYLAVVIGSSLLGGWVAGRIGRPHALLAGTLVAVTIQVLGAIPLFRGGHYHYSWLDWYFLGFGLVPPAVGAMLAGSSPPNTSLERTRGK